MNQLHRQYSSEYLEAIKKLSPRECQILDLITEGKTSREIAQLLHISPRTVDNHRSRICNKIGLKRKRRGALKEWISDNIKYKS